MSTCRNILAGRQDESVITDVALSISVLSSLIARPQSLLILRGFIIVR